VDAQAYPPYEIITINSSFLVHLNALLNALRRFYLYFLVVLVEQVNKIQ